MTALETPLRNMKSINLTGKLLEAHDILMPMLRNMQTAKRPRPNTAALMMM